MGRIAALENKRYNDYHKTRQAQLYLFDCENDPEAVAVLFEQVFAWARARGLTRLVGPKGFGPLDGYGLLVEGFEHRQLMTRGRLFPLGLPDLLLDMRRTRWVALNGAGILPEFQGHGGNALLYSEMEKAIREFHFLHADLTQVAESAVQMRRDLMNLGGKPYKNHRVYGRAL